MTPEEIANRLYLDLPPWEFPDEVREQIAAALRAYGDERARQERARIVELVRNLGWDAGATDAMRVAATTLIAALT